MKALHDEMAEFYTRASRIVQERGSYADCVEAIWETMDRFAAEHSNCSGVTLKAQLHEEIARQFEPVIFPHSPFFFEMELRASETWGIPGLGLVAGAWLINRREKTLSLQTQAAQDSRVFGQSTGLWYPARGFDCDHNSLNFTELLRVGVNGILRRIEESAARPGLSPSQKDFLDAAARSNRALIQVSERFADKAEEMLETESDQRSAAFWA